MTQEQPLFVALELIALGLLPEKARVARIAHRCLERGRSVRTLSRSRQLLEELSEPWGAKTRLARELRAEVDRQAIVRAARRRLSYFSPGEWEDGYDPVIWRTRWPIPNRNVRWALVANYRIARHKDIIPEHHWNWRGSASAHAFIHTAVIDRTTFALIQPSAWHGPQLKRYLAWTDGKTTGYAVVRRKTVTVEQAVESLKPKAVKKLMGQGYKVTVDWNEQIWKAQNPSRRKPRIFKFKLHVRTRTKETE